MCLVANDKTSLKFLKANTGTHGKKLKALYREPETYRGNSVLTINIS